MVLLHFILGPVGNSNDFRKWGLDCIQQIQRDFYDERSGLYGEERTQSQRAKMPAYTWGVGVMLQALNAAARTDSAQRSSLSHYIDSTTIYWNVVGPVAGYDVQPMPKSMDRYYDDNEWMVLGLVEATQTLESKGPLHLATDTYRYVRSGLDSRLGGGVYWRESDHASKNTCSNGPAAAAALALYDETGNSGYLDDAKAIYAWTYDHLRDPLDGLYWDNQHLTGRIEKTKWSYNSGLMLRSAANLYRITHDLRYAKEIQNSSLKKWVAANGTLTDGGKFIHLLLENWLTAFRLVPGTADPRPAIDRALRWLHQNGRDHFGRYGDGWDHQAPPEGYSNFNLIDQASVARAYLLAAEIWPKVENH